MKDLVTPLIIGTDVFATAGGKIQCTKRYVEIGEQRQLITLTLNEMNQSTVIASVNRVVPPFEQLKIPGEIILVGDFNCTLSQEDKSGTWKPTNSLASLRSLVGFLEMEDSQPPGAEHTWYGAGRESSARLDRVYFSSEVYAMVSGTLPSLSDHRMVTFVVEGLPSLSAPKAPVWRAKQEWFDSPSLCSKVNSVARSYAALVGVNLVQRWDEMKRKIKRVIVTHRLEEAKEAQLWSGEWVVPGELTRVFPGQGTLSPTGTTTLDTMVTKR